MSSSSLLMILFFFFLQLHYLFQSCYANCTPSAACGIITNISSPFFLKSHPTNCSHDSRDRELACEDNVASIYFRSQKYYVKDINYVNKTIRLVDASINNDDPCSFPNSSAYAYNFTYAHDRSYPYYYTQTSASPINFMSCPYQLKNINSSLFTDITHDCASFSSQSHPRFTYIKVGHMHVSEVPQTCGVELIVLTSFKFKFNVSNNNLSLSDIHHSLLYGFELDYWDLPKPTKPWGLLLIPLVILVLLASVGVSHLVMIIIGFAGLLGILMFILSILFRELNYQPRYSYYYVQGYGYILYFFQMLQIYLSIPLLVGIFVRFMICPFVAWLLIYKFRRRHLSIFQAIESFLQSDNNITPIRYSYSDIKKMTKGFQDKLGEGGYGSVYKGRLRSGNDVAVKILGKSGANDKDFMNEIATIGRIHHVNIVKLVGYCAQGSKRALVFDFMPNGSLEKYLFNPEKMNSLSVATKFDIAVGVARGIGYLHRGCDIQILHFDIKPHNILLDDKFIPKISDFGLAKIHSADKNIVTLTAARGTIGYVAPELISRSIGEVSNKADVYSFGMVLIEMMNLKRDMTGNNGNSSQYFPCWIYDHLNQDKGYQVRNIDENRIYYDNDGEWKLARKMTIVALWCIQMNPDDRPSMNKVLEMLEGEVERLQIPNYPLQSPNIAVNEAETWDACSSTKAVSLLGSIEVPNVEISVVA